MMEGPTNVSILLFPMKGNPLGSSFASSRGVNQRPGSTDTEKDRAKAEKDRIGVTDGGCIFHLMEELRGISIILCDLTRRIACSESEGRYQNLKNLMD